MADDVELLLKILVVDDEPLVCDVLCEGLRGAFEAKLDVVQTGQAGAEMLSAAQFDLAVIDAGLPGVSGFALAKLAAGRNIPVLLTSGHPQSIDDLRRFGFPHLAKPFPLGRLAAEVETIAQDSTANLGQVRDALARMASVREASPPAVLEPDVTEVVRAIERMRLGYRKPLPIRQAR